jgi:branched-chain amino acid transport system ATP-binding protein
VLPPTQGSIIVDGEDVTALPAAERCQRGVGRTFQVVKSFETMTVIDNVIVGALVRSTVMRDARRKAHEVLEFCGLGPRANVLASDLVPSEKRRLEVARALATEPKLLLLDEVLTGLTPVEAKTGVELVRKVRETGVTVLMVEHVMEIVMPLVDRAIVLDLGKVLVEGKPKDVVRDPKVITAYQGLVAISAVSIEVAKGEIVCVAGANGAGKSTLLKSIAGAERPRSGTVSFDGVRIDGMAQHVITSRGIAYVPENRRLFPRLSVHDNLRLGSYLYRGQADREAPLELVFNLFPRLQERLEQRAETLSGGGQQMLAIGRALMTRPRLLMLDEPSQGIMPKLVDEIFQAVKRIRDAGMTVLIVEQRMSECLEIADRAYILQTGRVLMQGSAAEISVNPDVRKAYLGL